MFDPLTDLLWLNARRLIEVAVAAEFVENSSAFGGEWLLDGMRRVVRNGYVSERKILTGIGAVAVPKPRGICRRMCSAA